MIVQVSRRGSVGQENMSRKKRGGLLNACEHKLHRGVPCCPERAQRDVDETSRTQEGYRKVAQRRENRDRCTLRAYATYHSQVWARPQHAGSVVSGFVTEAIARRQADTVDDGTTNTEEEQDSWVF